MSFKRAGMDIEDGGDDNGGDAEPFQKRQRFDSRGRGQSRGRGWRDRGSFERGSFNRGRGRGGFRSRGGFNKSFDNEGGGHFNRNEDNETEQGFRGGRGGRGFRGRGRGRDDRSGGRGFHQFSRGRGDTFGRGFGGRGRGRGGGERSSFSSPRECKIKVGQDAPKFDNIFNDKSEKVSLNQFKGKYVVLFIYFQNGKFGPKVIQENYRDLKENFEKLNATILGVSRDDQASHAAAASEGKLNFSLLADTNSKITTAYDAIANERVYQCSFIISPEGKIAAVWPDIKVFDKHPQEVLDKLTKIANGVTDENEQQEDNANDEADEADEAGENQDDENEDNENEDEDNDDQEADDDNEEEDDE